LLGEGEAATTLNSCPSATTSLLGVWAEYLRLPLTEPIKQKSAAYAGTSRDVFFMIQQIVPVLFFFEVRIQNIEQQAPSLKNFQLPY
jgi:hypothetical protein